VTIFGETYFGTGFEQQEEGPDIVSYGVYSSDRAGDQGG